MASRGSEKLQEYLTQTLDRLEKSSSTVDKITFEKKAIPSVVASIQQLSSAVPADLREEFKRLLVASRILPEYNVDVMTATEACKHLQHVLRQIEAILQTSLEESRQTVQESSQVQLRDPEVSGVTSSIASLGDDQARVQFRKYVRTLISKLSDPASRGDNISDAEFASNALPQILSSLKRLSSCSPPAVKMTLARILTSHQILPHLPVGMDPSKSHLANFPANGGAPQTKPLVLGALQQLSSFMHQLEASSDPCVTGLESPIRIAVLAINAEHVANITMETGTSVAALRNIVGAMMHCPPDTLSLVQMDRCMHDEEVVLSDTEITVLKGQGKTLAGVYAGYSCDILVLYPDGKTAAAWHDDYWQPPKGEEHHINRPIREVTKSSHLARYLQYKKPDVSGGSWRVEDTEDCRIVKGTAYEAYLDNFFNFEFQVKYDGRFSEGISPLILDGSCQHRFGYSDGALPDKKPARMRYYRVLEFEDAKPGADHTT